MYNKINIQLYWQIRTELSDKLYWELYWQFDIGQIRRQFDEGQCDQISRQVLLELGEFQNVGTN